MTYERALLDALDALQTLDSAMPRHEVYTADRAELSAMIEKINAWHDMEESIERSAKEQGC